MRTMYDSVAWADIPTLSPGDMVAYYVDGLYQWPKSALADPRFDGHTMVGITVTGEVGADVVDCENGDLTPEQAAQWWKASGDAGIMPTVYCSLGAAPAVVAACRALMADAVPQLWVADWTNLPHMVTVDNASVVAVQWTSDTSANYDESLVSDTWVLGKLVSASELTTQSEAPMPPVSAVGKIVACVSRPAGGGWLVFEDGSVWTVAPAPFYGSYDSLPASERQAAAVFVGAVWGDGKGNDGYTLIQAGWNGSESGLYRFGPAITTK